MLFVTCLYSSLHACTIITASFATVCSASVSMNGFQRPRRLFFFSFDYLSVGTVVLRTTSKRGCYCFSAFPFSFLLLYCCYFFFFLFNWLIYIAIVSSISDIDMALYCCHCILYLYGIYHCLICNLLSVEQSMVTKMRQFRSLCTCYCSCPSLLFFAM